MKLKRPLGYMLGQTLHLFSLKAAEKFKDNKFLLNFDDFVLLYLTEMNPELTQQDIANHFQRDKSMILRKTSNLIEKGYIERIQDSGDRRKKNLILTSKGAEALQFSERISKHLTEELLTGINERDIEITFEVLTQIQKNSGMNSDLCKITDQIK